MKFIYLILIFCFAFLTSCHKDDETSNKVIESIFTAQVVQEITGTIIGYVYDENNLPVADAIVEKYKLSVRTNTHGVFVMKNVAMDKQGTYIKVSKNGFVLGSDLVYPQEKGTSYAYIKMMRLENKTLDAKIGGNISITGGGKITFPANAIADQMDHSYEGIVNVTAKFLDPNDKEIGNIMPGGLMGDIDKKYTVVLGTLGMIAVELRDKDGNELNLKKGISAKIEIPAVTSLQPKEIDLWSFDEDLGRWIAEGKAALVGDYYVAEVNHFSFWNCDAPFPLIEVCGKVLYQDGIPAANIGIQIMADGLGVGYGYTNSLGEFCGKMPKGKKLTINISHYNCNQYIFTTMVGPFENNVILDNIVIDIIPSFIISGNINCNGSTVSEGIVVVKIKESTIIFDTKEDGSFKLDLTGYLCGDNIPVVVFGFDQISSETSPNITITPSNQSQVNLNICNTSCGMIGTISFDCIDKISVSVTNGSGNYSYKWNDNLTTGPTVTNSGDSLISGKLYCVTVTDVNNVCEKVFCKTIKGKPQVFIRNECQSGKLNAQIYSGLEPYTYLWSNGSTGKEIDGTSVGSYCLTVTDANGCSASACTMWSGLLFIDPNPTNCNSNMYNINSSAFTQGNYYVPGTNLFGQLTFPININIFDTKFDFILNIVGINCEIQSPVMLPKLIDGLVTTVVNTTCTTCTDGKINYTIVNGAICENCVTGNVKIFNINDINTDLSIQNTAGLLAKGEYYVVVTDKNNGCYIAFNKIKIS
ncbi:MAG: carboxypeptidase regulatory-like domain-containing protein [Saprospiraceae bacterium]|nr:carboxypeptidase regulatory-like domain-containing protein [Saprospiraceae bacterium]